MVRIQPGPLRPCEALQGLVLCRKTQIRELCATTFETAYVTTCDPELNYSNNVSTVINKVIYPVIPALGAIELGGIGVDLVGWLRRHRMI